MSKLTFIYINDNLITLKNLDSSKWGKVIFATSDKC